MGEGHMVRHHAGAAGVVLADQEIAVAVDEVHRHAALHGVFDTARQRHARVEVERQLAFLALQLQMRPVIGGIAHGVWHGFRPLLKLLPVAGIPCAVLFIDPVGAHSPPFVMIAIQPYLGAVGKLAVNGNVLRRNVTVVVENRHFCRMAMI